jgi:UDP-N-acetylmuramyl pentapeptide phosphotransferase/UDP-N-acetylglucosamine-1-phosphate transferase
MLDPGQAASLEPQMRKARTVEMLGIVILVAALIVTIVAYALNIQGSGVPVFLVVILVLAVAGLLVFFLSLSMGKRAIATARSLAIQRTPEFFTPDGEHFSEAGLAFLRGT